MRWLSKLFEFVGKVGLFSLRVIVDSFRPPFEFAQFFRQVAEVGNKSLTLIVVSGFALGAVMTLHTRSTLVMFGATAMIPAVQAVSFFVEIGPVSYTHLDVYKRQAILRVSHIPRQALRGDL